MDRIIDTCPDILAMINRPEVHDFCITLAGSPAMDQWPDVDVILGGQSCWQGRVHVRQELQFDRIASRDGKLSVEVVYKNKLPEHTVIKDQVIVENQIVCIQSLVIDNITVREQDLSHMSRTNYDLTDSQKQAYNDIGADWQDVMTTTLYNNGRWRFEIAEPWICNLTKHTRKATHVFEIDHADVLRNLQQHYRNEQSCGIPE